MVALACTLPTDPLVDEALAFAEGFYPAHEGETLVVGLRAGAPVAALAVAVPTERHKAHLLILSRYQFARHGVDAYLVLSPGTRDGREEVVVECVDGAGRRLYAAPVYRAAEHRIWSLGCPQPLCGEEPLLGDLLARGQSLPGTLRRELDRAYDLLRIDYRAGA